jgi:hypothetical protein
MGAISLRGPSAENSRDWSDERADWTTPMVGKQAGRRASKQSNIISCPALPRHEEFKYALTVGAVRAMPDP